MNFTPQQQQAIEKRGRIIVSAAAGSGKTAVMIERLLSLILSGTDVREILALTFTNKAAAQMRDRARTALSERLKVAGREERARLKEQLAALPLAEIGTIHAFCGRLVRTYFYLTDADAGFGIISPSDPDGLTLQNRALDLVFEEEYEKGDPAFLDLLSVWFRKKKDRRLREIVRDMYASLREIEDYRALLENAPSRYEDACAYLARGIRETAELIAGRLEGMREAFAHSLPKALPLLDGIVALCDALDGDLFEMRSRALAPFSLPTTPRSDRVTGETLKNLRFLSGARKKIKDLYDDLRDYGEEETERARCLSSEARARALSALILRFDDEYARLKREANVLDYNDLQHYALRLLSDEEVLAAVRGRYTHVFVDEYQDVNRVQEKLLSLIAGGEVFLVGDSKQAIYGFRGSSSAFFDEKRVAFRREGGDLPLSRNFRSAESILDAVNRVFAPLSPFYEKMEGGDRFAGHTGEVRFHKVIREKTERGRVGVYSVKEGRREEKTDEIATYVANLIEEEVASAVYDADQNAVRKAEFGDIAVLVRKHSGAMERVVRELTSRGIPVSASSSVNLCDFSEVRLLIDWLSLLDNAEQDAPLCSALLSAVGGFTEDDLSAVRLACPDVYTFRAACRVYAYADIQKDNPLAGRLRSFFAFLKELRAQAQARSAADVLSSLLSMGLEIQIAAGKNGEDRLSRVRRFVALSESKSVHEFLAEIKAADERFDFAGGVGENAVQVLTMHASKGLEFPVVILTDLDVPFHGAERGDVLFTERFGLAPFDYDLEKKRIYRTVLRRASELLQENEERLGEKNLLYVAMTRAKYRLHMLFGEKDPPLTPAYAARLSDFVEQAAFEDLFVAPPAALEAPLPRSPLPAAAEKKLVDALAAVYRAPYPFTESTSLPLKSSATDLMRRTREEKAGEHGPIHTKEEGIAYHAFLQHVEWGKGAEEELARMRERELLTEEQLALLDVKKLERILSLPCLQGLQDKRTRREQTFLTLLPAGELLPTAADEEILFQGAIDLLVEDESGFTVVDYKFSGHSDERIRADYALQIALYRKAVARVMGVRESTVRARIVNIALLREIEM